MATNFKLNNAALAAKSEFIAQFTEYMKGFGDSIIKKTLGHLFFYNDSFLEFRGKKILKLAKAY